MVTVTEMEYVRASCCIHLDNGTRWWIRRDDLPQAGFREGSAYEEEAFQERLRLCQYPRALNHAVSMLARRACSRKEISDRLKRLRYTEEVAELVVYKLEKEKLLDDAAFCRQWIRYRLSAGYGPSVIRRELRMKGISEDIIDSAFAGLDEEAEQENALAVARKAWKRTKPTDDIRKNRQKVITALVRKGYSWEAAREACHQAEINPE